MGASREQRNVVNRNARPKVLYVYVSMHMFVCTQVTAVCVTVCVCVCVFVCARACVNVCVRARRLAFVFAVYKMCWGGRMDKPRAECVWTFYVCLYQHTHTYIYTCIASCIHIHIHILMFIPTGNRREIGGPQEQAPKACSPPAAASTILQT